MPALASTAGGPRPGPSPAERCSLMFPPGLPFSRTLHCVTVGVSCPDGAADSDQTRGKTGLCDFVDHLGLHFASLQQPLAHDSEKQEIVHSVRDTGGGAGMIGPAHRPLSNRHMVEDPRQTAIIDGTDLIAPLPQRVQRVQHRLACFIVQRDHDSLRIDWPRLSPPVPRERARISAELLSCEVGTTATREPEAGWCRALLHSSFQIGMPCP